MPEHCKFLVYLVDDNPIYLKSLQKSLSETGMQIETYTTGELCLLAMDKKPNAVILDYFLNSVSGDAQDGLDILKRIRQDHPDTVVVMLSSQDSLEVAIDSIRYGAFDYIVKNESSLVRAKKILENISMNSHMKRELENYKKGIRMLAMISILVLAGGLLLQYFMG